MDLTTINSIHLQRKCRRILQMCKKFPWEEEEERLKREAWIHQSPSQPTSQACQGLTLYVADQWLTQTVLVKHLLWAWLWGFPEGTSGKEPAKAGDIRDTGSTSGGKMPWRRAWQPTPASLPGEPPWTEEPGGLQSVGSHRVGHKWSDFTHRGQTLSVALRTSQ